MSLFILSQILIGIAIVSDIITFQFKKRVHILSFLLFSSTMISMHFMCLGHWTAACLTLLGASRYITSLFSTSKKILAVFMVVTVIISALTFEGLLSFLGCTGALFGCMATFSSEDKHLRQFMFICTSIWIVHNYLAGSPGAVLKELIFMSSNMIGYYRYYFRPRIQPLP